MTIWEWVKTGLILVTLIAVFTIATVLIWILPRKSRWAREVFYAVSGVQE